MRFLEKPDESERILGEDGRRMLMLGPACRLQPSSLSCKQSD